LIKILSISGSPVSNASTDILLNRVSEAIKTELAGKAEAVVSFVKLNAITFRPCQSCGVDPTPRWCFYEDLYPVLEELAACDCLLFGSPIYFDSVSAQAKAFIDRCNCFRPAEFDDESDTRFIKRIQRSRPGAMVLVGGERGWFEGARRVIAGFFKWVEVTNDGNLMYSSPGTSARGAAVNDSKILTQADELGKHLANLLLKQHGVDKT
jgi:multimeric flavodoxin WrbA